MDKFPQEPAGLNSFSSVHEKIIEFAVIVELKLSVEILPRLQFILIKIKGVI